MNEFYSKHFVMLDAQDRITDAWSDGPHPDRDTAGAICINDKGGYQFRLLIKFANIDGKLWHQQTEENPPLYTMDGIPLYKWDGKQILPRTKEEIEADRPDPLEIAKSAKLKELSATCHAAIVSGCDVQTSKGIEHFSLEETDQINLTTAAAAIQEGATSFPYHSDGNMCRLYSAREISLILTAATQHRLYHTTLCNHLFQYAKRATTKEKLDSITYNEDSLPEDLRKSFNAIIQASKDI